MVVFSEAKIIFSVLQVCSFWSLTSLITDGPPPSSSVTLMWTSFPVLPDPVPMERDVLYGKPPTCTVFLMGVKTCRRLLCMYAGMVDCVSSLKACIGLFSTWWNPVHGMHCWKMDRQRSDRAESNSCYGMWPWSILFMHACMQMICLTCVISSWVRMRALEPDNCRVQRVHRVCHVYIYIYIYTLYGFMPVMFGTSASYKAGGRPKRTLHHAGVLGERILCTNYCKLIARRLPMH